jgi:hypothetical protein
MAPLTAPYWEALPAGLQDLLSALGQIDLVRPFYLAGGTALALRLEPSGTNDGARNARWRLIVNMPEGQLLEWREH